MKKRILAVALMIALIVTTFPSLTYNASASEVKPLELVNHISTDLYINKVVASPDSNLMLIHDYYRDMYLYNISTGIRIKLFEITPAFSIESMCFSLDSSMCAIKTNGTQDSHTGMVTVFDTKSGEELNSFSFYGSSFPMAFGQDNTMIVGHNLGTTGSLKPGISVIDIASGTTIAEADGRTTMIRQNPSTTHFASVNNYTIRIFNGKSGGSIRAIEFNSAIESMSYSPDGKFLAVSGSGGTKLYDVEDNYNVAYEISGYGRISFINDSDMIALGNCVYYASDTFTNYTLLDDPSVSIDAERCFLTANGKYFVNYKNDSKGIRLLDSSKIAIYLRDIRFDSSEFELVVGESKDLKLTGVYSDGSTQVLDINDVTTTISNFSVAKSIDGKIYGLAPGDAVLKATYYDKTISVSIKVVEQNPINTAATWARDNIVSALDKGFIPDDLQDNYSDIITRQEFCRMAVQFVEYATDMSIDDVMAEKGVTIDVTAFSDTNDKNILAAYALGITNGTSARTETSAATFTPDGQFTREQAATMLLRICEVIGIGSGDTTDDVFADIDTASSWAVDSINFCYKNGIMGGTGSNPKTFSPKSVYTRQESIITFDRIK